MSTSPAVIRAVPANYQRTHQPVGLRILLTAFIVLLTLCCSLPHLVFAQSDESMLDLWRDGDEGEKLSLRGRVLDPSGKPIPGVMIQLRQADGTGEYRGDRYNGSLVTDERGEFKLRTVVPGQYTSAKHIHVSFSHENFQSEHTEILFKADPNIDLGVAGGIEVVLEKVEQNGESMSVGGLEVVMQPGG